MEEKGGNNRLFPFNSTVNNLVWGVNSIYSSGDTKSSFLLNIPNGTTQFQVRFTATNNRIEENWAIDALKLTGDVFTGATPSALPSVTVPSIDVCTGANGILSAITSNSLAPNTYLWSAVSGTIVSGGTTSMPTVSVGNYLVTITDADFCTATNTGIVAASLPLEPTISDGSKCGTASSGTALAFGAIAGQKYKWYDASSGGTLLKTSTDHIDNSYSASPSITTSYWVSILAASGCEGPRAEVKIIVSTIPSNPLTSDVNVCEASQATIVATGATVNEDYLWYNSSTILVGSGSAYITPVLGLPSVNNFYVSKIDVLSGCESNKVLSTVTNNALPTPAITGLAAAYCKDATAVTLTGTPTGGVFKIDGTATTTLTPSSLTVGSHTVTYFYTDANSCAATATETVTINALPTPAITGLNASYCKDAAAVTLTGTPTGGIFKIDGTATTTLTPISLTVGSHTVTYFYTDANSCAATATESVTINALPTPAITGLNASYCKDAASVTLTGTPTGGTFKIDGTVATTLTPSSLTVGSHVITYVYSDANSCAATATETVIVNALPIISSITGANAFCQGNTNILTALPTGGVWTITTGNPLSLIDNANGTASIASTGTGTAIATYTLTDLNGCTAIQNNGLGSNTAAPMVINNGTLLVGPSSLIASRYRHFRSTAADKEIYIGVPDLGTSTNRTETEHNFTQNATTASSFKYDPLTDQLTSVVGSTTSIYSNVKANVLSRKTPPLSACVMNDMDITLTNRTAGAIVSFKNVILNGQSLPDFIGTAPLPNNFKSINITGLDYAKGFTITGDIELSGSFALSSSEVTKIDIVVGYSNKILTAPAFLCSSTNPVCEGSPASLTYTGLQPNTNYTFDYTIGGGASINSGSFTSNASGTGSFNTPNTTLLQNGAAVVVTSVNAIFTASSCSNTLIKNNLNLIVKSKSTSTTTESKCTNFTWNGTTYTNSGTYTYTTLNAAGCDSVATLNLTIRNTSTSTTTESKCTSFTWNGTTYTTSGIYTYTTSNAQGCDSVATLNLTIRSTSTSSTNISSCSTINWNGQTVSTTGIYQATLVNAVGCDSIATLNFIKLNQTSATENVTVCSTSLPYLWNGQTINNAGTFTDTRLGLNGCDSITTLNLVVTNATIPTFSQVAPICSGTNLSNLPSVSNNGVTGNWLPAINNLSTTTYSFTPTTVGCIAQTNMTIIVNALPTIVINNPAAVCNPATVNLTTPAITAGSSIANFSYFTNATATMPYNSPTIASAGTYYIKATNANGCVSISNPITVTINPASNLVITNPAAVCFPNTVNLLASSITAGSTSGALTYFTDAAATIIYNTPATATSGNYYVKLTSVNGCVDIEQVAVIVNALPNLVVTNPAAVCGNATVDITLPAVISGSDVGTITYHSDAAGLIVLNTPTQLNAGTYYIKLTNASGCSVIKMITVIVNPLPNLFITNPPAICSGNTYDITAANITMGSDAGTITYFSNMSGTIVYTTPAMATAGTYYIKLTNSNGCSIIKPVIVSEFSAAANVFLTTASTNTIPLELGCEDGIWTYYVDPADRSKFIFGIKWGTNLAAKATAVVKVQLDANISAAINTTTKEGAWTMKRFWDVKITSALTDPNTVKVRFFYAPSEKAALIAAADAFVLANPPAIKKPLYWFKTNNGLGPYVTVGAGAQLTPQGVSNSFELTDLNTTGALINNVLYAEFSVTGFSGGTLGVLANPFTPLAVNLVNIKASVTGENNTVYWNTVSETNNKKFIVEKSTNNVDFVSVGEVLSKAINGTSISNLNYIFVDNKVVDDKIYYRLKIIDLNDKINFTNTVLVQRTKNNFSIISCAPTLVSNKTVVTIANNANEMANLVVIDLQGKVMMNRKINLINGFTNYTIDASKFAGTMYYVYAIKLNKKSNISRFVKE